MSGTSEPLYVDILTSVFQYLPWRELLSCTLVDVYWHLASLRYMLLTMLEIGACRNLDSAYDFILQVNSSCTSTECSVGQTP